MSEKFIYESTESEDVEVELYKNKKVRNIFVYDKNKKLHSFDRPAIMSYYENGDLKYEKYFFHGKQHRDNNLPGFIEYDKNGNIITLEYYKYGDLHRIDGPASISYNSEGENKVCDFYVEGRFYSQKEFEGKRKLTLYDGYNKKTRDFIIDEKHLENILKKINIEYPISCNESTYYVSYEELIRHLDMYLNNK